jgi:hypothetical protein
VVLHLRVELPVVQVVVRERRPEGRGRVAVPVRRVDPCQVTITRTITSLIWARQGTGILTSFQGLGRLETERYAYHVWPLGRLPRAYLAAPSGRPGP